MYAPQFRESEALSWDDALPQPNTLYSASPADLEDLYRPSLRKAEEIFAFSDSIQMRLIKMLSQAVGTTWGPLLIEQPRSAVPPKFWSLCGELGRRGYIRSIGPHTVFCDEPRRWQFIVHFSVEGKTDGSIPDEQFGSTAAADIEHAFLGSLGEALERQMFLCYRNSEFQWGAEADIRRAVPLSQFHYFSEEQLRQESFVRFRRDANSKFSWCRAWDALGRKSVMIPAQLVFWNYRFREGEPRIVIPTTNGEAAGQSRESAALRALLELIERDAFMIFWLRRMTPPRIDLAVLESSSDTPHTLQSFIAELQRYGFEAGCMDITSDFGIPVIAAVIRDPTGVNAAVAVGAKADFDPYRAIEGALHEALAVSTGMRIARRCGFVPPSLDAAHAFTADLDRGGRLLLWSRQEMFSKIEWFLEGNSKPIPSFAHQARIATDKDALEYCLMLLRQRGYSAYFVDRTPREIAALGFDTVKAVVPQLVPLYLYERWPYLGCERLVTVPPRLGYRISEDSWNPLPHPFP